MDGLGLMIIILMVLGEPKDHTFESHPQSQWSEKDMLKRDF